MSVSSIARWVTRAPVVAEESVTQKAKQPALLARRAWCVGAAWFLAACTTPALYVPQQGLWRGRLSLTTEEERPRSYSGSFELRGHARQGELEIFNPLGNIVAKMAWSPGQAWVNTGSEQLSGSSLDELVARVFGMPIPVQALFSWLQGEPEAVVGWQVDVSRYAQGRISAVREQPLPRANLRVILQSADA